MGLRFADNNEALIDRLLQHLKLLDIAVKANNPKVTLTPTETYEAVKDFLSRVRVDGKTIAELDDEADQQTHCFRHELWEHFGRGPMLGMMVPEEHDGMGLGNLQEVIGTTLLARQSASFALSKVAHSNLFGRQIIHHGTEEQKEKLLPGVADGTKQVGLAMSETGAGTNVPDDIKASAVKVEGGWVLNGDKYWITNGARPNQEGEAILADAVLVYAKTGVRDKDGKTLVTPFILERNMERYTVGKKIEKEGMRGSDTYELLFDNVFIPDENVLGGEQSMHKGARIMMDGLVDERLHLAAINLGTAIAAWEDIVEYTVMRKQGRPIAHNQHPAVDIARMYEDIEGLMEKLLDAALKVDLGIYTSENDYDRAADIFDKSSQIVAYVTAQNKYYLGGNGQTPEYRADRRRRDSDVLQVGGGGMIPARAELVARRVIPGYAAYSARTAELDRRFNQSSGARQPANDSRQEPAPQPGDGTMG